MQLLEKGGYWLKVYFYIWNAYIIDVGFRLNHIQGPKVESN